MKFLLILAILTIIGACSKDEKKETSHESPATHTHDEAIASHETIAEFEIPEVTTKTIPDAITGMVLEKYYAVYQQLITDNFTDGIVAVTAFAESLTNTPSQLSATLTQQDLINSATAAAESEDIDALRHAFKPLSENIITLVMENGYTEAAPYYIAFCPMYKEYKKTYWIQKTNATQDPYHGKEMRRCGRVTKIVK